MIVGDLGKAILKGIAHKGVSTFNASGSWEGAPWSGRQYLLGVQSWESASALDDLFAGIRGIDVLPKEKQNYTVARRSDIVVLACPPGAVESVLKEDDMRAALSRKILISLAAGVTISQIDAALYGDDSQATVEGRGRCWIVRAMPNIAAAVGASSTAIVLPTDPPLPQDKIEIVDSFFQCVGGITHIPESQMDAASVVCGASPAFMALFCDAIIDGAVAGGLPRVQAEAMTAQAMASTAALLAADGGGEIPSEVRENVCANPGITIGGILELEKGGVRGSIAGAVRDSIRAARSMGKKDG